MHCSPCEDRVLRKRERIVRDQILHGYPEIETTISGVTSPQGVPSRFLVRKIFSMLSARHVQNHILLGCAFRATQDTHPLPEDLHC